MPFIRSIMSSRFSFIVYYITAHQIRYVHFYSNSISMLQTMFSSLTNPIHYCHGQKPDNRLLSLSIKHFAPKTSTDRPAANRSVFLTGFQGEACWLLLTASDPNRNPPQ
ncbi:hypothetical protein B9Z55_019200 [Caenorhabditis nigoni]|uniref:Uncharacterized protein n=1 Tax=Caenorhabditis nigoni TaxID=1611254 RepID=A0A2G5TI27_9PELO|nr:hypothetical protein B9Z55_019200 [Caenorhabditis nigoni]